MEPVTAVYGKGQRSLSRRDPVLRQLIKRVGPCTLQVDGDGFRALVRSIVAQLISTRAAASIFARLQTSLPKERLTPKAIRAAGLPHLRGVGLSTSKAQALLDLAERIDTGVLPLARLPELDDEEVIEHLVAVRGIGRWTAEMFLIFSLGRLDVLPVGDFGLRAGVQESYGLAELPGKKVLDELGEKWRPYRSLATWYFWRSRGFVPQSA
jgi:DNA-3-methyladenine glycosylase II